MDYDHRHERETASTGQRNNHPGNGGSQPLAVVIAAGGLAQPARAAAR